jgi:DNA-binding CsgD family transcriptional regulator
MENLTPRQLEMLALVGNGRSHRAIAEKLVISPRTVEHTIRSAKERLDASTVAQAVARAVVTEQLILGIGGELIVPTLA